MAARKAEKEMVQFCHDELLVLCCIMLTAWNVFRFLDDFLGRELVPLREAEHQ